MESKEQSSEKTISLERQELLRLENEFDADGKCIYVFHGSDADVDQLDPRQAVDVVRGPDGPPAVFASDRADFAIFFAIINRKNCPEKGAWLRAGADFDEKGIAVPKFETTQETLNQIQDNASGWVYVFKKEDFNQRPDGGVEYTSKKPVEPFKKVKVFKRDLPENVEIIKERKQE